MTGASPDELGSSEVQWSVGSRWLRWDPHIHAPGTLRNNQFGDAWDDYIQQIENAQPAPHALGITDYFTLRTYKEVLRRREGGALQRIPLIFPNVELRLTIETKERSGINLHLLVAPDDEDHVTKIEEKLSRLLFRFEDDSYPCTDDGLIRLGRAHRHQPALEEHTALSEGANQFKVEFGALRDLFDKDPWLRGNVLVAIAAGNDGLAGLSQDASFRALREELGRFAHVVFSGNPADRSYWLGKHSDFDVNRQRPKPCLHGCDAHRLEDVLQPDEDRRCWIRAEPTFDGLRQTLVEPERRVHLGADPPAGEVPGDVIRKIKLRNAPWLKNDALSLNDGLVTIIGAKGSGKTALVDLLAFAAGAGESEPGPASFIAKAGDLLHGIEVELEWDDGSSSSATLPPTDDEIMEPRVRYLSQHFVERLCAPGGLTDPLVEEIERVVFSAIPEENRLECDSFADLRSVLLEGAAADQHAAREATCTKTKQVAEEIALERSIPTLRAKLQSTERDRKGLEQAIKAIPIKVSNEKVKAQQAAAAALQSSKTAIAAEERRTQKLRDLEADVKRQARTAETAVEDFKLKYPSLLLDEEWTLLQLRLSDDALPRLAQHIETSSKRAAALRENGLPETTTDEGGTSNGSQGRLPSRGLAALTAENERLTKELGLDRTKARKRGELEKRLATAKQTEQQAKKRLTHAEGARDRRQKLQADRLNSYERLFTALASEEEALRQLYRPLQERIEADPRLQKLSFVAQRVVDINTWAAQGEELLDLRKPPFQRRGALAAFARAELLEAWTTGSPSDAHVAMKAFVEKHASDAMKVLAQGSSPREFGEWLFSTDHISIRYGIQYEGVDVAHLSPGTKGVVLLTLYLGLDQWDQQPLVIDQPEENLDPRSVYTDLVPFFRAATRRRQVIMVTHNANLVVNTDSDQVIIADAHRASPTDLPTMTYFAGGLEDPKIRSEICSLLEGGEEAFRKRAERYGLLFDQTLVTAPMNDQNA